ncbi:nucleoside-binding protein [Bacillus sp. OV194]|nr:nucleoside-binding protein [Bacillus sp. OV194]
MKRYTVLFVILAALLINSGCSMEKAQSAAAKKRVKIGIMLSDAGLGDQSFSDAGFAGLEKARDEQDIVFNYRELATSKSYEAGIESLVKEGNDLVIGLGFSMQKDLEKVAQRYPKQKFLLIDSQSKLSNVYSITFKEEEGSYLVGAIAGMKTKSNVAGFIGGVDVPLIRKFEKGFIQGMKALNPKAKVISEFAGTFDDDKLGEKIAKKMIAKEADYIYPPAGFTGVGALLEAQKAGVYALGVDTDQYYLAEKAIATSILKKVDVAIYQAAKQMAKTGHLKEKDSVLGIKEGGIDIAPIRVIHLNAKQQAKLNELKEGISQGTIHIEL